MKKAISSFRAALPKDKEILTILRICRLSSSDKNWRFWQSTQGTYIRVQINRRILVCPMEGPDPSDLLARAPATTIAQESKLALISSEGLIFFWGIDDRLRLIQYRDDWVSGLYPLQQPIADIRLLVRHAGVEGYRQLTLSNGETGWVTQWPPHPSCLKNIRKINEELCNRVSSIFLAS